MWTAHDWSYATSAPAAALRSTSFCQVETARRKKDEVAGVARMRMTPMLRLLDAPRGRSGAAVERLNAIVLELHVRLRAEAPPRVGNSEHVHFAVQHVDATLERLEGQRQCNRHRAPGLGG